MANARLIIDPPADGAWNMAVDEALLRSAAEGGIATLRFYQWSEPTLSLGYFQAAGDRQQHAASQTCPLVRRASGGGAIVHDRELTYSLALPQRDTRATPKALYDAVHSSLIECFAGLGIAAAMYAFPVADKPESHQQKTNEPFLCFQRRACGDIVSGNAKVAGSAQRRRRGAVLQHGSLLLARSAYAPDLAGIEDITGMSHSPTDIMTPWLAQLSSRLGISFEKQCPTKAEIRSAEEIRALFCDPSYTLRRP